MKSMSPCRSVAAVLAAGVLFFVGCGDEKTKAKASGEDSKTSSVTTVDDHSGWWCPEHGVPEEMCSLCDLKLQARCKEKGDWCEEHQVAKSHCFQCDPSLREKFAAMYRAKYPGQEPPPIK